MFFEPVRCGKNEAGKLARVAREKMLSLDKRIRQMYEDGLCHDEAEELRRRIDGLECTADKEERIYDYWLMQGLWAKENEKNHVLN